MLDGDSLVTPLSWLILYFKMATRVYKSLASSSTCFRGSFSLSFGHHSFYVEKGYE